jgi:hypothetical protein
MKRHWSLAVLGLVLGAGGAAPAGAQRSAPIFRIATDDFWLNLHHFLYVLGRAENGEADATREAVNNARRDAGSVLARFPEAERSAWQRAVRYYANGPSRQDLVFDQKLIAVGNQLARVENALSLAGTSFDSAWASVLETAAPLYRQGWWPEHQRANIATRSAVQRLIDRHGESVLAYITRAYGLPWPAEGYPIHYSGYTNWAGAYSTAGNLLVVSSLSTISGTLAGMEILFHEAMHQWDDTVFKLLRVHTRALGALVPNNLTHAMIFLTAGEAVRSVVPDHVPYAEIAGIWNRGMQPFRAPLIETWKPWLDGAGSRDDAMAALMLRTVARRPPG